MSLAFAAIGRCGVSLKGFHFTAQHHHFNYPYPHPSLHYSEWREGKEEKTEERVKKLCKGGWAVSERVACVGVKVEW